MHYKTKFDKYKMLWKEHGRGGGVIIYILNKTHSKTDYPEQFNLNGVYESYRNSIANNFNVVL